MFCEFWRRVKYSIKLDVKNDASTPKSILTYPNASVGVWWIDPALRPLNFRVGILFLAAVANGYSSSLITGLMIIQSWRVLFGITIDHYNPKLISFTIAALVFGGVPFFIAASYISDRLGRRFCLCIGIWIMLVGSIAQCIAKGIEAFIVCRVMIGIGLAFNQISAPTLVIETAHPRHREEMIVLYNVFWYFGAALAAIASLVALKTHAADDWGWRIPCIVQVVIPFIQLITFPLVLESPRYLVAAGRRIAAEAMLYKYHSVIRRKDSQAIDPLVEEEIRRMSQAITQERNLLAAKKAANPSYSVWREFLSGNRNRHRTFICIIVGIMIQLTGNGVISFYLFPMLNSVGVSSHLVAAAINVGLQFYNLFWGSMGAHFSLKYGRRALWLTSAIGMFLSMIGLGASAATYLGEFHDTGRKSVVHGGIQIALIFIFYGFYSIGFTPLQVGYVEEVLPYHLRAKGVALNWFVVFLVGGGTQIANAYGLVKLTWRLYFIYTSLLALWNAVIYFTFPETKGFSCLEDIPKLLFQDPEYTVNQGIATDGGLQANDIPTAGPSNTREPT
ncbi:hypothetical protein TWF694_006070 [Orbilia ellipsospora]|uniref:Major facilitator superfamily (MFS) profile domain-containing protein n=1 Tax=Orbilia ellipsospora TaxID=2528407 RepID=A0AAV9WTE8_9PEZI